MLLALLKYIAWTIVEGDPLNDWVTHLPVEWQQTVIEIGTLIAATIGS